MTTERIPEHTSPAPWTEVITEDQKQNCTQEEEDESLHSISIETEFPANNGSPKSTRRNLERAPSSGSLDSAYHSKGFVKYNGMCLLWKPCLYFSQRLWLWWRRKPIFTSLFYSTLVLFLGCIHCRKYWLYIAILLVIKFYQWSATNYPFKILWSTAHMRWVNQAAFFSVLSAH